MSPRLVRANHTRIRHRLAASQHSDKKVLSSHLFRGERQCQSDSEGQAFRFSDDDQSYRDEEGLNKCKTLLVRCPPGIAGAELHEEPDEKGDEEDKTRKTTEFGDELVEIVKL